MKKITALCLIIISINLSAQKTVNYTRATDYKLEKNTESIKLIRGFWKANRETSYLSLLPFITPVKNRRIPTIEGEGTSDIQLVEAFLNLSYPLFFGKLTNSKLISLEYTGNFRMTLDDSKPLTPGSHKIGFSLYNILSKKYSNKEKGELRFFTSRIQIKHYSNGQAPGFHYVDPNDITNKRNAYLDGDFSTNLISFQVTKGVFRKFPGSLHQMSFEYRHDLGTENSTFAYSKEQENSYGRNRFQFTYDYRTKRWDKRYEHHYRFSTEYILGNLDSFTPNLINSTKKYRMSFKGLYEFAPKKHYSVGYFVSMFYGRDYLNIRYDDLIFSLQAGLTLNLDKFFL